MRPRAKIIGIQVHHSIFLHGALAGAFNAAQGLNSARVRRPDDEHLADLERRARALAREIAETQRAASERLRAFPDDVIIECREGHAPYPDEPAPWPPGTSRSDEDD